MLTNEQNVRMMNGMKGEHVVRNEWMNEWMQIGDEWIIYNIPSLVVDLRLSIALVAASQKLKYNGKTKNLIMKLISYREKIGENCSLIAPSVDLLALDRNISQITMIFNIMGKKLLFVGVHRSFSLKKCQTINIPLNHAVSSRCAYHFPSSHTY